MAKIHTKKKQLDSILIKPAGPDCNMACTYCFYLEKSRLFPGSKTHRMKEEILEETIRQVMEHCDPEVSFGWQGGEPTLMGLSFFEKAVKFQERYGRGNTVGNGIQTNGLLIDKKWASFLKTFNFLVGLSLDGPEYIHDRYRCLKSGLGSWENVVACAKLLLDAGVAVNALTVVNDYSVKFPREIYEFHKDLGLTYMQFIPCVESDSRKQGKMAPFTSPSEQFGRFLCTLFDLWQADFIKGVPSTSVRYFDSLFFTYVGYPPPQCTLMPSCGVYTVVEHNGDVYSCDFFVEPKWKLGNVMNDNLSHMLNSNKQYEFGRIKADLSEYCKKCKCYSAVSEEQRIAYLYCCIGAKYEPDHTFFLCQ